MGGGGLCLGKKRILLKQRHEQDYILLLDQEQEHWEK